MLIAVTLWYYNYGQFLFPICLFTLSLKQEHILLLQWKRGCFPMHLTHGSSFPILSCAMGRKPAQAQLHLKVTVPLKGQALARINTGQCRVVGTHPSNAVILRVLFLQTVLLQGFSHSEVGRVSSRQQDCLVGDIWL